MATNGKMRNDQDLLIDRYPPLDEDRFRFLWGVLISGNAGSFSATSFGELMSRAIVWGNEARDAREALVEARDALDAIDSICGKISIEDWDAGVDVQRVLVACRKASDRAREILKEQEATDED